jgi:hypothetical protein
MRPSAEQETAALAVLANGVIPPDARDAGAAVVAAGPRLAAKLSASPLYRAGLDAAEATASDQFGAGVAALSPKQVHHLLDLLRERQPAFFRQLRMDVCALYLSDPSVWERIGFPGPSTEQGGYPDFDQPQ